MFRYRLAGRLAGRLALFELPAYLHIECAIVNARWLSHRMVASSSLSSCVRWLLLEIADRQFATCNWLSFPPASRFCRLLKLVSYQPDVWPDVMTWAWNGPKVVWVWDYGTMAYGYGYGLGMGRTQSASPCMINIVMMMMRMMMTIETQPIRQMLGRRYRIRIHMCGSGSGSTCGSVVPVSVWG